MRTYCALLRSLVAASWMLFIASTVGCGQRGAAPAYAGRGHSFEPGPDGSLVFVYEAGPRHAPWLLLIHGLGEHASEDFGAVLPALAQRHRVIVLDLPGFGRSPAPRRAYSPEDYVRVIQTIVSRRTKQEIAIVGHSMGGAIGILYASKFPEQVSQLALLDVAGIMHFREYARTLVAQRLAPQGNGWDPFRRLAHALFRVGVKTLTGTQLDDLPVRATPTVKFISYDFGPALQRVQAQVFLGWGRHDRTAPLRTMDALRFWLRPTRVSIYEQSAHLPMRSEPWSVARDLLAFLSPSDGPRHVESGEEPAQQRVRSYLCRNQSGHELRGDYEHIHLDNCQGIKLSGVRARSLSLARSSAELRHVELLDGEVGVAMVESELSWTGGRIRSETCLDTTRSHLNLMAVNCHSRSRAFVVRGRTHVVASVSSVRQRKLHGRLHGEYTLERGAFHGIPTSLENAL